ncbi:MAG: hypothetical protein RI513_01835 [Balneolaceae bacterium]|nr:hypothetical protein [Balneolaceae bacterium]
MRAPKFKDWSEILPDSIETLHVFPKHRAHTPKTDYLTQFYAQNSLKPSQQWISHSIWGYAVLLWANPARAAVHQHWLEATNTKGVLAFVWKWVCLQWFLLRGGCLIWTCHNVEPHQRSNRWVNAQIQRWLLHRSSAVLVHCTETQTRLERAHSCSDKAFYRINHPSFEIQSIGKDESRQYLRKHYELENNLLNGNVLEFFGNIASYKQIPQAIEPFLEDTEYVFWIVGPTKPDGGPTLEWLSQQAARYPNRFWIHPVEVDDEEAEWIVSAADVMMFNHRSIDMSGGVALGLSARKPTVAPFIGCIKELSMQSTYGLNTDLLHPFSSSEQMVQIVDKLCAS